MRLLSYFHTMPNSKLKHNPTPISSWRPYRVSYCGQSQDFLGVFIFGESPAMYSNAISTLLNGSLVSLLVIEDGAVLEERKVARGEGDGIPYFTSEPQGYSRPFDPAFSKSVGVALIRSIDIETRTFWLLTPANVGTLPRKNTVLAFGGLDNPGWAYLENAHFQQYAGTANSVDVRHILTDLLSESPWVESRIGPGDEVVDTRLGMRAWKTRRFKKSN
jgi:hypothetical protein